MQKQKKQDVIRSEAFVNLHTPSWEYVPDGEPHVCDGGGELAVGASRDRRPLGLIITDSTDTWDKSSANLAIPDGVHALCFTFNGYGNSPLKSFILE